MWRFEALPSQRASNEESVSMPSWTTDALSLGDNKVCHMACIHVVMNLNLTRDFKRGKCSSYHILERLDMKCGHYYSYRLSVYESKEQYDVHPATSTWLMIGRG